MKREKNYYLDQLTPEQARRRIQQRDKTAALAWLDQVGSYPSDDPEIREVTEMARRLLRIPNPVEELREDWVKHPRGVIVNDLHLAKKYARARADYHGRDQSIYTAPHGQYVVSAEGRAYDPFFHAFLGRVAPRQNPDGDVRQFYIELSKRPDGWFWVLGEEGQPRWILAGGRVSFEGRGSTRGGQPIPGLSQEAPDLQFSAGVDDFRTTPRGMAISRSG